jgi:hypothetical protein
MADYAEALSANRPPMAKKPKPQLMHIMLSKSDNGGVVAEHRMSGDGWSMKEPKFTFASGEGHKLAEHLTKHLGMQIHGNMADGKEAEEKV